jgi:hypothetical protein
MSSPQFEYRNGLGLAFLSIYVVQKCNGALIAAIKTLRPVVTTDTGRFKIKNKQTNKQTQPSAHTLYLSFLWISERTAIISLYSINWLVFQAHSLMSVCPSICPSVHSAVWKDLAPNGRPFMEFDLIFGRVQKLQVLLISDKDIGYFTWIPIYILVHISVSSS